MTDEIKQIDTLIKRLNYFFREKEWEAIHITKDDADIIIAALQTKRNILERLEDDGK